MPHCSAFGSHQRVLSMGQTYDFVGYVLEGVGRETEDSKTS